VIGGGGRLKVAVFVKDPSRGSYSFETRDSAHLLCAGQDGRIYTVANRHGAVDVFELDGTRVESFSHGIDGSVGAVLSESSGVILLCGFHSGSVVRCERRAGAWARGWAVAVVAAGLGTVSGLSVDSRERDSRFERYGVFDDGSA
jgi:hypothetical protein